MDSRSQAWSTALPLVAQEAEHSSRLLKKNRFDTCIVFMGLRGALQACEFLISKIMGRCCHGMKQPAGIRNTTWHRCVKGSFEIGFVSGTRWVLGLLGCVWPGGVGRALTGNSRTTAEREAMHAFIRGRHCSKVTSLVAPSLRSEAITC